MQPSAASTNPLHNKLAKIIQPGHPLCKDDVIWVLDYIKKKVAEEDPQLMHLPQARLLKNFHAFTEVAMLLIHRRPSGDHEIDRLKRWLAEAAHGLDKEGKHP